MKLLIKIRQLERSQSRRSRTIQRRLKRLSNKRRRAAELAAFGGRA